jgi:hypothetical protein
MADYELLQVVFYIQVERQSPNTIHMFAWVIFVTDLSRTTSGCFLLLVRSSRATISGYVGVPVGSLSMLKQR